MATTFEQLKKRYKFNTKIKGPVYRELVLNNVNIIQKITDHWRENEHFAWPDSPYYQGVGLHYSLQSKIDPREKQVCGYRDQDCYNDTLSYDQEIYNNFISNITGFKTVRSKITQMNYAPNAGDHTLWHNDETPFEALRVIIPLESDPVFKFQLEDRDPMWLEPGKIYAFDQSIPHRVFCSDQTFNSRLHLVLGITTWFHYIEGMWIPNEHCETTHPMDLLDTLEII